MRDGFSKIRILFELRYDARAADSGEVKADVFYDDLYLGPAVAKIPTGQKKNRSLQLGARGGEPRVRSTLMPGKRYLLSRWLWLGPLVAAVAIVLNGSTGAAQETTVRLETPPDEAQLEGPPFTVNVVVDNVVNLAAFQFALQFDPKVLEATAVEEGPFLRSSGREVVCRDEEILAGSATLGCVTLGAPVSLGGTPGADGAGILATVEFIATGKGETSLSLQNVKLVEAEIDEAGAPVVISIVTEDGRVMVAGGGGFPWVLWGPVIGGVVLVVSAAAASLWWFRLKPPAAGSAAAPE